MSDPDDSTKASSRPSLYAVEVVARAICNAHRTWPGRSDDRQREIVNQAWRSHEAEARDAIAAYEESI